MRFALVQSVGVLLRAYPPSFFARLAQKTLLLDAEARDDGLFAVAPAGAEVVVASATPHSSAGTPYGPVFDPAQPPFPPRSFHVVLAGPSLLPRTGADRERAFQGLLGLTRGVLVLALPASGSLGELGAEAAIELARRRLGAGHPWLRTLEVECGREGPTPGELDELAGAARAALLYVPAGDPVGGAALAMFRAFVLGLPDGERLAGLVDRFFNTALTEAGPTLTSRYHDLALVFPGRRSVPGAVAALAAEERTAARVRGRTDVASLQLALELDALDRRGPVPAGGAGPGAAPGWDAPPTAELARWREVLEEMGRKVERMAKDAELATGRALEGTDRMQARLEAALATVAKVRAEGLSAQGLEAELAGEREVRARAVAEAAAAARQLETERTARASLEAELARVRRSAEETQATQAAERARVEAALRDSAARLDDVSARAAQAEAEAAEARRRRDALEAEFAALRGQAGDGAERTRELEAELARTRTELETARAAVGAAERAQVEREAALAQAMAAARGLEAGLADRTAELEAARDELASLAPRLAEADSVAAAATRAAQDADRARIALEGRLAQLQASYDGLAAEIEEFRRVVSSNPLLKAYIVAKGARVPGSAAAAAPGRA